MLGLIFDFKLGRFASLKNKYFSYKTHVIITERTQKAVQFFTQKMTNTNLILTTVILRIKGMYY